MNNSVKIAVLGDKKAGKTSFIHSFTYGTINDQTEATIDNTFIDVVSFINGKEYCLSFLDTTTNILRSASPQYNELMDMIKTCSSAIIILDLTNQFSLSTLANYIQIVNKNIAIKSEILVIGNKTDAIPRLITNQDISYLLSRYRFTYFEASFKNQRISNERRLQDFLSRMIGRMECHSIQIQFPPEASKFELDVNTFKSIYKEKGKIGSGAFGDVIRAEDTRSNQIVAIKTISPEHLIPSELNLFKREVLILCHVRNIFLTNIIGFTSQNPFSIIMEYVPNGNLFHYLHQYDPNSNLDNTKKTIIAMGIAYGMGHVHDMKIIHRDLKSMNILLDNNYYPKICDFGVSKFDNNFKSTNSPVGTAQWMAPEMMNNENYTNKIDIYSYSMILFELLTLQIPFYRVSQHELIVKVVNRNERPKLPSNTPKPLEKLIKETWDRDPQKRPDFHLIFERFANHEVEFDQTDKAEVDKFLNYIRINNHQDPYLKKINATLKQTQSQYQLPSINNGPGVQIQQSPLSIFNNANQSKSKQENSNQLSHQKDIEALKSENLLLDIKMKKGNNNDSSPSKLIRKSQTNFGTKDSDVQSDEDFSGSFEELLYISDPNYQQIFKKASNELNRKSISSFYKAIIWIFENLKSNDTKSQTEMYNVKMILNQLCEIIKRPHFMSSFISSHLLNYLPFENLNFIDDSIKVLKNAIEINVNCVTKSFVPIFKPILYNYPEKAILVYHIYVSDFDSIYDPWPFLDSALQSYRHISNYAQKNEQENTKNVDFIVSERYISIFYYLCKNFSIYRKARCYNCTKYMMRMLSSIRGKSAEAAYLFLSTFYQSNYYFNTSNNENPLIEIDFDAINQHLLSVKKDQVAAFAALSFIMKIDRIDCDESKMIDLCKGLLRLAKISNEATFTLNKKIAPTKIGYELLIQDQVIFRNPIPTFFDTFNLFAELCRQNFIMFHNKCLEQDKISVIFAESIPLLFTRFLSKETDIALPRISTFLSVRDPNSKPVHPLFESEPIYMFDAATVTSLDENGFFELLLEKCQSSTNLESIKSGFIIVKEFAFYKFVPEFNKFIDIMIQRCSPKDELRPVAINVIAFLIYNYNKCTRHLKKLDLSFLSQKGGDEICEKRRKFILSEIE